MTAGWNEDLVLLALDELAAVGARDLDVVLVAVEPAGLGRLEPGHIHRTEALLGGWNVHVAVGDDRSIQDREAVLTDFTVLKQLLLLRIRQARCGHDGHVVAVVEGVQSELVCLVFPNRAVEVGCAHQVDVALTAAVIVEAID